MCEDNLLFDLDGVLLDSEGRLDWLQRALERTLLDLGIKPSEKNLSKLYPDGSSDFKTAVRDLPAPPEEVWRVRDNHYLREKLEMIREGKLKPFPDVKVLPRFENNYVLGVISNSPQKVVDEFLRVNGLRSLFRFWVGRGLGLKGLEKMKPSRYLFDTIEEKLEGGRDYYVGDTDSDRRFAARTEMKFFHLNRTDGEGFHSLYELADKLL